MNHTDDESHVDDVFDDSTVNSGSGQLLSSSQDKSKRAPRKRFRWTDELRYAVEIAYAYEAEQFG